MKAAFGLRRLIGAILGTALIGTATAVAAAATEPLNPPVKIRINSPGLAGLGGMYLANDKGYFKEQGLDVFLDAAAGANTSADTVTQLATGQLEVGLLSVSAALFNAISRDIGLVGLMPLNTLDKDNRATGTLVRQDLIDSGAYKTPADLKGKKIAILTVGANGHYNVNQALKSAGLTDNDVNLVTMSFPDALAALGNKAVDAAFQVEPFISAAAAQKIGSLAFTEGDFAHGGPAFVLYSSEAFAEKNNEALKRLTVAMLKGQRDYIAAVKAGSGPGYEELLQTLSKHSMIKDVERLRKMALPAADPNGDFDPAVVASMQDFLLEQKVQAKPIDTSKIFDPSYLEYAVDVLGRQ
ncbi:MAG: ABC transporter substrate-binding protein [Pusillimonas sp.]